VALPAFGLAKGSGVVVRATMGAAGRRNICRNLSMIAFLVPLITIFELVTLSVAFTLVGSIFTLVLSLSHSWANGMVCDRHASTEFNGRDKHAQ